jgi:hypothetical protein
VQSTADFPGAGAVQRLRQRIRTDEPRDTRTVAVLIKSYLRASVGLSGTLPDLVASVAIEEIGRWPKANRNDPRALLLPLALIRQLANLERSTPELVDPTLTALDQAATLARKDEASARSLRMRDLVDETTAALLAGAPRLADGHDAASVSADRTACFSLVANRRPHLYVKLKAPGQNDAPPVLSWGLFALAEHLARSEDYTSVVFPGMTAVRMLAGATEAGHQITRLNASAWESAANNVVADTREDLADEGGTCPQCGRGPIAAAMCPFCGAPVRGGSV